MNKALIVVDMQNDFVYGALGTPEARAIIPSVVDKIMEAYNNGDTLIYTRDIHFAEAYERTIEGNYVPSHCVAETPGAALIEEIKTLNIPRMYSQEACKSTYAYPFWGDWHDTLGRVDKIELIGVCTDICVVSNALVIRSKYPNIPVCVDASCCAGTTPERHKAALEVMKSCNVEVINE